MRTVNFILIPAVLIHTAGAMAKWTTVPLPSALPVSRANISLICLVLSALLIVIGVLRLLIHARRISRFLEDLSPESPAPDLTGNDFKNIADGLRRYVEDVHGQQEQVLNRVRELEIQLKVADVRIQQAQSILYSISDGVLVTDAYDDLMIANEAAARSLGFDLASANRKPVENLVRDNTLASLIRQTRQGRQSNRIVEHSFPDNDGACHDYKITLSSLPATDEAPGGVVAVLHDTTREKEIARLKNDFVSNVTHELRTPLASIKAYAEMLIDGEAPDDKTRQEFYEVIHTEANRLGHLIDNILNISRIESGLVKYNKKPVSLMVLLKQAVEVIKPQAKQKEITVEEQIAPSVYQTLADKDMLHEVLLNLLSNAVKYTPQGGKITVRSEVDEARKVVSARIIDTGVGIPQKDLPFVFDKFYRAEANNGMAKGTGLGLSLVKRIIESVHGGKMIVESQPGKGSTFGFELTLAE